MIEFIKNNLIFNKSEHGGMMLVETFWAIFMVIFFVMSCFTVGYFIAYKITKNDKKLIDAKDCLSGCLIPITLCAGLCLLDYLIYQFNLP